MLERLSLLAIIIGVAVMLYYIFLCEMPDYARVEGAKKGGVVAVGGATVAIYYSVLS